MDLAKAKSVIIVILLAFNFFLLFNNLTYYNGQGVRKETVENAAAILKARGVTLESSIPTNPKGSFRLVYGNGKLDRTDLAEKLLGESYVAASDGKGFEYADKKLVFSSDTEFVFTDGKPALEADAGNADEAKKAARKYLEDKGLLSGKYVVDELTRNQDGSLVVKFIENYRGFLVYDNYSTVTVAAKGITRLEYGKLQIIGFSADKVEDLTAAYQVLLANFKEGSRQVITNIDIGYRYLPDHSMNGVESVELLPVWRVKIKGASEPVYLNAFDAGKEPSADLNAD